MRLTYPPVDPRARRHPCRLMTPITIHRSVLHEIRQSPTGFTIQVQDAADPTATAAALERATTDIRNLDAGWESAPNLAPERKNNPAYVSDVIVVPSGPLIYVDGGHVPHEVLVRVPFLVESRLIEAGIEHATLTSPDDRDPLTPRTRGPFVASLAVYPPLPWSYSGQPPEYPRSWFDLIRSWVGRPQPDEPVWVVMGLPFQHPIGEIARLREMWRPQACPELKIGTGNETSTWREVRLDSGTAPCMRFTTSGPGLSSPELARAEFEELREIARSAAPECVYAIGGVGPQRCPEEPRRRRSRRFGRRGSLCDVIVWTVAPYQILGPGHIERLGEPPAGAVQLENGRWELELGPLYDWVLDPGSPDEGRRDPRVARWREHYRRGQEVLRPCLVNDRVAERLYRERLIAQEARA